ncbi:MAG TPA: hypothetical protein PLX90_07985, partial [Anaerolineales bacterium]|nr:hypothetical protein [Anaerolineales bacterium]
MDNISLLVPVVGLIVVTITFVTLRMMLRSQTAPQANFTAPTFPESTQSNDAVLILQPGGRVEYLSNRARSFFGLRENEPYDLERLARYVRPSDDFLDVCSAPNSKRVSISGRLVEITSYEVPGTYPMMLVALRGKEGIATVEQSNGDSSEILELATEFSQSIAASLDLTTTVNSILNNVGKLVPSDVLELKIWDAERKVLVPH